MSFIRRYRMYVVGIVLACILALFVMVVVRKANLTGTVKFWAWLVPLVPLVITIWRFWEERRRSFQFDLKNEDHRAILRVSNYGTDSVFISKLHLRTKYAGREFDINRTAEKGDVDFDITDAVLGTVDAPLGEDLDLSFEFRTTKRKGETQKKGFQILMLDRVVERITSGFGDPRNVSCPNCSCLAIFEVDGLQNGEQVTKRRKKVLQELRQSCPNHKSRWIRAIADGTGEQIRRPKSQKA